MDSFPDLTQYIDSWPSPAMNNTMGPPQQQTSHYSGSYPAYNTSHPMTHPYVHVPRYNPSNAELAALVLQSSLLNTPTKTQQTTSHIFSSPSLTTCSLPEVTSSHAPNVPTPINIEQLSTKVSNQQHQIVAAESLPPPSKKTKTDSAQNNPVPVVTPVVATTLVVDGSATSNVAPVYVPTALSKLADMRAEQVTHKLIILIVSNMKKLAPMNSDDITSDIAKKVSDDFFDRLKLIKFKNRLAQDHENDVLEFTVLDALQPLENKDERSKVDMSRPIVRMTWTTHKDPSVIDRLALYKLDPHTAYMKWYKLKYTIQKPTLFNYVPFLACIEELDTIVSREEILGDILRNRYCFNTLMQKWLVSILHAEGLSLLRMVNEHRLYINSYTIEEHDYDIDRNQHNFEDYHKKQFTASKHISELAPANLINRNLMLLTNVTVDYIKCCNILCSKFRSLFPTLDDAIWELIQKIDYTRRQCEVSQNCISIASNSLSYRSVLSSDPADFGNALHSDDTADERDVTAEKESLSPHPHSTRMKKDYDFLTPHEKDVFRATSIACVIEKTYTPKITEYCYGEVLRRKFGYTDDLWPPVRENINDSVLKDQLVGMYTTAYGYQKETARRLHSQSSVRASEFAIGATITNHCLETLYYDELCSQLPKYVEHMIHD